MIQLKRSDKRKNKIVFNNYIQDQINNINIADHRFKTTKMKAEQKKNPKFNDTDIYRVRKDSRLNQGLFLCKVILKKHGTVQIQGMGQCISLVTKMSQILSKNGFATMKSLTSENVQRENSRSINPKLTVKLEKTKGFDQLTENIVLKND